MSAAADGVHVLHVDDDPDYVDLSATLLERETERITVRTATAPGEGLDLLADGEFDCVVSDYDMPGTNGIEFLEAVREEYPDLPFILYTGKGSEAVASDAISAGVTDYLQKEGGTDQYTILGNRITNAVDKSRAEREVERTRKYFGTILEHASDYVMIVDNEGRVDYISPSVERMMGYSPQELEGSRAFEFVHPEDLHVASEALADILSNPDEELTVEFRARHADGSWRWIEARGRNRLDDPIVEGVIVNARDITEKKASRRQLETVINNLPGIVYRTRNDPDWPMEFVRGDCLSLTGYPAEALETNDVVWRQDILHPDDREPVCEAVQDALDDDRPFEVTYRIRTAEGTTRWVWERGRRVDSPSDDGEILEGFITDITERTRYEQEPERRNERPDDASD